MIIKKRRFQATVTVPDYESKGNLKMNLGFCYLPKKLESNPESLGEDAHFICQKRQTFGVADGVGGWAMKGIVMGETLKVPTCMRLSGGGE
jgi:protein phosphatase PTC7|uniref:Protein phosphatase n=1 Tax=Populus trichocarpa TaxID=3694 RepID=A0A2K1YI60_POPTR